MYCLVIFLSICVDISKLWDLPWNANEPNACYCIIIILWHSIGIHMSKALFPIHWNNGNETKRREGENIYILISSCMHLPWCDCYTFSQYGSCEKIRAQNPQRNKRQKPKLLFWLSSNSFQYVRKWKNIEPKKQPFGIPQYLFKMKPSRDHSCMSFGDRCRDYWFDKNILFFLKLFYAF